ncbi:hypothetical protein GWI33_019038 [Rhynchophorus ferrugineus]|uniref:Uncharacterized protein n=1 Tax=Rhynchophorus ferrugineus TaxID=354439 RepID=A0A834M5N4_RHYFE|nr:hypothetical protein GWI33_019038 [Rhynchophorus ferrugineus]
MNPVKLAILGKPFRIPSPSPEAIENASEHPLCLIPKKETKLPYLSGLNIGGGVVLAKARDEDEEATPFLEGWLYVFNYGTDTADDLLAVGIRGRVVSSAPRVDLYRESRCGRDLILILKDSAIRKKSNQRSDGSFE